MRRLKPHLEGFLKMGLLQIPPRAVLGRLDLARVSVRIVTLSAMVSAVGVDAAAVVVGVAAAVVVDVVITAVGRVSALPAKLLRLVMPLLPLALAMLRPAASRLLQLKPTPPKRAMRV